MYVCTWCNLPGVQLGGFASECYLASTSQAKALCMDWSIHHAQHIHMYGVRSVYYWYSGFSDQTLYMYCLVLSTLQYCSLYRFCARNMNVLKVPALIYDTYNYWERCRQCSSPVNTSQLSLSFVQFTSSSRALTVEWLSSCVSVVLNCHTSMGMVRGAHAHVAWKWVV